MLFASGKEQVQMCFDDIQIPYESEDKVVQKPNNKKEPELP